MSVGNWEPPGESAVAIDPKMVDRLLEHGHADTPTQLQQCLSAADRAALPGLMRLPAECWAEVARPRSDEDLLQLLRFFALAENLEGCEVGALSPVIPLARTLRRRGRRLDRDLLLWMRQVNRNRFLPYGAL